MFALHAEKVTIFAAKMVTFPTRNINILLDVLVYNIEGKNDGNYIKTKGKFQNWLRAHLHLHKNGTARVKFGTGATTAQINCQIPSFVLVLYKFLRTLLQCRTKSGTGHTYIWHKYAP